MKKYLWILPILLVLFLIEEIVLLPLNLQSGAIWFFIFVIAFIAMIATSFETQNIYNRVELVVKKKRGKNFAILGIVLLAFVGVQVFSGPMFSSNYYANRTNIVEGDFAKEVEVVDLDNIALVDKESAQNLGDRVMGNLPDLVSQFAVSSQYNQITYQGHLYRITPLEYNGFFKWMSNSSSGTPGYILVDSTTGEATLKQVEGGMKYVPSAYLFNDLARHIFNSYPTKMLCESTFEIDEEGNPYWITPVKKVRAVGLAVDIQGVITTSAIDGTNSYYTIDDVPEWIDHVYPTEVKEEQINSVLKYQGGFFNTLFAQKGVRELTPSFSYDMDNDVSVDYTGYQYIGCNAGQDVCMYSGVTSAAADDSNLGFVLGNLRTGEVNYYAAAGAEEYSAINTARGATQEKNYTASFPILVNLDGRPTYILSLKDDAGLVKAYALVDVQNYQKVSVTNADQGIKAAVSVYQKMMGLNSSEDVVIETKTKEFTVSEVNTAVVDGNTMYYILTTDGDVYLSSITVSDKLPFVKSGDVLKCEVSDSNIITEIK